MTIPPPTPKIAPKKPATTPIPSSLSSTSRTLRAVDPLTAVISEPERAALLFDVDGVLAPIVARPEDSSAPPETRRELERLARQYGLVACVSGRTSDVAREIVGVEGLRYVGQHGLELEPAAEAFAERVHAFGRAWPWQWQELKPLTVAYHYRLATDEAAARGELERVAAAALDDGLRTRWG